MRPTDSKSNTHPSDSAPQTDARAVPTFIATDLMAKLIADRDARAVDRVVTASRRH